MPSHDGHLSHNRARDKRHVSCIEKDAPSFEIYVVVTLKGIVEGGISRKDWSAVTIEEKIPRTTRIVDMA